MKQESAVRVWTLAMGVLASVALAFCLTAAFAMPAHAASTGWKLKSNNAKLVYVQKDGTRAKSCTIDGITLKSNGYAKMDTAGKLKVAVMKRVKQITSPSMSKREKLLACTDWVKRGGYLLSEPADYGTRGWVQRTALKVMKTRNSECVAAACAIAMFAYELGYKPKVRVRPNQHSICIVNGRGLDNVSNPFFDPDDGWPYKPWKEWKVVSYSDTSPKGSKALPKGLRGKKGLVKYKGRYYYVKHNKLAVSKWKTVKGKKYYFDTKGQAVTGAQQIDGKWYVFSKKGKLLTGKKTRVVSVSGVKYRVKKNGRAAKGWNSARTAYYLVNGMHAKGLCCVDGNVAAFSAKGVYQSTQTAQLRRAVRFGGRVETLIEALAAIEKPRIEEKGSSCYPLDSEPDLRGTDRRYTYAHLQMDVFVANDGRLFLETLSAC